MTSFLIKQIEKELGMLKRYVGNGGGDHAVIESSLDIMLMITYKLRKYHEANEKKKD